jgi:exonuclease SbcC
MKILRITLSNIASIAGTHTVDFTQEPLRSAGLFAISGPTGAGKSSLLDALCLALYDQTPRLNKLGRVKDIGNESQTASESLLRRGTARGFVEVAFVGIDSSPYTARWDVRRARESVDGTLKDANIVLYKGHITPDTKGEIEADGKKTAVLDAIKNKIGLSFEQFTRAVLLAQNDFAAFLKAKDTERAEILQKLTGTQEYEEISKRVYQRCNEFQVLIKGKNALIQGNPPLTDDERTTAEERYNTAKRLVGTLEAKVDILNQHSEWYEHLAGLKENTRKAEEEWKLRLQEMEQAAPRREEMELTEIVKHEATRLRENQKAAEKERSDAHKKLATSAEHVDRTNEEASKVSKNYEEAKAALNHWLQQEPQIRADIQKAREVEQRIAVYGEKCRSADDAFRKAENAHSIKRRELDEKKEESEDLKAKLDQAEVELRKLQSYESIAKDAALWINRIDNLISLEAQESQKKALSAQQQGQLQDAEKEEAKQRNRFDDADNRHKVAQEAYHAADIELKQVDIDHLETEWASVERLAAILRGLKGQLQTRNEKSIQRIGLQQELEQFQANRRTEELRLQVLAGTEIPQAELALRLAQEWYDEIARKLEDRTVELRQALVEGKACPVCGSLNHPFSTNSPTEDSLALQAAAAQVRQRKEQQDALQAEQSLLKIEQASHDLLIKKTQVAFNKLDEELSAFAFENVDNEIIALVLGLPMNEQISETDRLCQNVEEKRKAVEHARAEYRTKCVAIGEFRTAEIQRNTEATEEKRVLEQLEKKVHELFQIRQATEQEITAQKANKSQITNELSPVWAALPEAQHDLLVNGALFAEKFKTEIDSFRTWLEQKGELGVRIGQLNARIHILVEDIGRLLSEKLTKEKEQVDTAKELEGLRIERTQLLGNRDIQELEGELDQQRSLLNERLNNINDTLSQARINQRLASDNLSDAERNADCANVSFSSANKAFEAWLRQFNESHLIDWDVEQIDKVIERDLDWLIRERKELEELEGSVGAAKAIYESHNKTLGLHQEKRPTEVPHEVVLEEIERRGEQLSDAKKEAEDALKPITLDDDRRLRNEAAMKELRVLEEQAKPWQELNEIIGSADGSKFRTIAQQVSLDVLLQYTNQQLQQLAPRYRLKRLPNSLNLVVNDCDMGDEIRSIYSLSGGETFLVSLALALGLASLTSNRVRIESLFIDEGFGSLDPETLNLAMGALTQLESQGRKVGVISHVPEMADAIPVQIKIKKGRNGASRIEIPGVTPI